MNTPLLVETPIARRTDPHTSHRAAREITAGGGRAQQQALALAAVRAFPGHTSQELAELSTHDRYMLARRLPELEQAEPQLVHKGPARRCGITRKLALTWFPGTRDPEQLMMFHPERTT